MSKTIIDITDNAGLWVLYILAAIGTIHWGWFLGMIIILAVAYKINNIPKVKGPEDTIGFVPTDKGVK